MACPNHISSTRTIHQTNRSLGSGLALLGAVRGHLAPTSHSLKIKDGAEELTCLSCPFLLMASAPPPTTASSELLGGAWGGSLLPADRPNLAGVRGHASGHHLPLAPIQQVPSLLPPPVNSPSLPSPSLSKIEVAGSRSRSTRGAGGLVYLTPC